jgi:hypothetical protein
VTAIRTLVSPLPAAVALVILLGVTGCGGSASTGSGEQYPLVDPARRETPTRYEADPSPSCEREVATFHDGSQPTRRPIVIPPAPGLRATAVTEHTTRLEWSFRDLPDDCRPIELLVSVVASGRSTPTNRRVKVSTVAGTKEVTYPDFLPAPDVALASAYSREGHRSRTASVLIRRPADLPPDPPEPTAPVTAPAGEPIRCRGGATAVDDLAGDILTYAPGSPPKRVAKVTPALSGIDIRHATVQVDGRTICATFVFARVPESSDVELTLTLRDTTTPSCCASLRFRRSTGSLEVGHLTVDANGGYQLEPVPDAGASLRGNTLLMTGTLPPPSAWQLQTRRMPAVRNIGWSVTSRYFRNEYGPFYGDWLPGYEDVGEPVIRHRDGATVTPGATR